MFVACSTLCFARMPFDQAMRRMSDLEFDRVEYVFGGDSVHNELDPAWIVENKEEALQKIRTTSGLMPSSFDIRFKTQDVEEQKRQFDVLCWVAKNMMVAVVSVEPMPQGTPVEAEQKRLRELQAIAARYGVVLTLSTVSHGCTADPTDTVAICRSIPGLALSLDPSHYINGPFQSASFDEVFPYVQNTRLRDTGRKAGDFQMKIGQGEIDYNRIMGQLQRQGYRRGLVVAIEDREENSFNTESEIRKLKLVLESLL